MYNFAAIPLNNTSVLCIGGITSAEASEAKEDGIDADGNGYYLFLASADRPKEPIKLLAKFFSVAHAEEAARLFPAAH